MTPLSSWATVAMPRPTCFSLELSGRTRKTTLIASDFFGILKASDVFGFCEMTVSNKNPARD
jgi:hypothetical protein